MARAPDGVLPDTAIEKLIADGHIRFSEIDDNWIQPASIDLPLSEEAYHVGKATSTIPVEKRISRGTRIDLSKPNVFQPNGAYLVRIDGTFDLPSNIRGYTNPKSTTGRTDILARLLTEGQARYDHIPAGYQGSLWLEVRTQSFPIQLERGITLSQLRFFQGETSLDRNALLSQRYGNPTLLFHRDGTPYQPQEIVVDNLGTGSYGVVMHLDLEEGRKDLQRIDGKPIVGFRTRLDATRPIPFTQAVTPTEKLNPHDYFEPVFATDGELTVHPDFMYILSTIQRFAVPPHLCSTLSIMDPSMGDFRAHYAGFFDPGFGWTAEGEAGLWKPVPELCIGTTATLEVRVLDTEPQILTHGQPICKALFDILQSLPAEPYRLQKPGGLLQQGNYGGQDGPYYGKHFKPWI